ncbi:MAG: hypothetical protein IK080_06875 [Clostridia bacterium]|nr:hypothetical protein [Clostridia bacterium]
MLSLLFSVVFIKSVSPEAPAVNDEKMIDKESAAAINSFAGFFIVSSPYPDLSGSFYLQGLNPAFCTPIRAQQVSKQKDLAFSIHTPRKIPIR